MITVMMAGLSAEEGKGKMTRLIAEAVAAQSGDMQLCPYALAEESGDVKINIGQSTFVHLVPMDLHEELLEVRGGQVDVIVDFTQPTAVNRNAAMYCRHRIPFVMGTTGGKRGTVGNPGELELAVMHSEISAVLETNFSAWVNVMREMFRFAGRTFPGAFKGGKRLFKEGHQPKKKDVSGTMISILPAFELLFGERIGMDEIRMVRDSLVQEMEYGVSEQDTTGCGYHMYRLRSANGAVDLNFEHNIRGRQDYVDGCLQAIRFLVKHRGDKGKVFSMVDVLKG
jgi:4-hydroxy-tetrahydrodipicolinate reductase